ncbi:hypothetical protein BZU93_27685 [Salmonella enterica subsp. enterica]|nr:hypothetical protein [Salmonella enterica subsp. enterica serovar Enteritidis]
MKARSRAAYDASTASSTTDGPTYLAIIEHPTLSEPLLLAGDNRDLITLEPYMRGVKSTWRSPDGKARGFLYTAMSILPPDYEEGAPPTARLVVRVLSKGTVKMVLDAPTDATCRVATVQRSTPNIVEDETRALKMATVKGDYGLLSVTFSMKDRYGEPYPHKPMSKQILPGLFK